DVWTGHGQNGFPLGRVLVGTDPSFGLNAKLIATAKDQSTTVYIENEAINPVNRVGEFVRINGPTTNANFGIAAELISAGLPNYSNSNIGFNAEVRHPGFINYGFNAVVSGASNNGASGSTNCGLRGVATGATGTGNDFNYGVYGIASEALKGTYGVFGQVTPFVSNVTGTYAGYFDGDVFTTGWYLPSDQSIKENIVDLENANELLSALNVKSYNVRSDIGLTTHHDMMYGLISQEVEEVLPSLTRDVLVPAYIDTSGEVLREEMTLKSIRYNDLISILIKGHQEQNAWISSQAEMLIEQEQENHALEAQVAELSAQLENQASQMASLQEQMSAVMASVQLSQSKMNNCCGTAPQEKGKVESGKVELEQNFPNPFDTATSIQFAISEPAQIRLEISDSQGRVLEVLLNQRMEKGDYTERWDASKFSPGTYYYSLFADTELLTKKMIKR
ncbi:MAG: tail fiber domain-containing protein, partial [Bacteroidota bacterium]